MTRLDDTKQILTVYVHNPLVRNVSRLTDDGRLVIGLGNNDHHGHIALLVSDESWTAIVADVATFQRTETSR